MDFFLEVIMHDENISVENIPGETIEEAREYIRKLGEEKIKDLLFEKWSIDARIRLTAMDNLDIYEEVLWNGCN